MARPDISQVYAVDTSHPVEVHVRLPETPDAWIDILPYVHVKGVSVESTIDAPGSATLELSTEFPGRYRYMFRPGCAVRVFIRHKDGRASTQPTFEGLLPPDTAPISAAPGVQSASVTVAGPLEYCKQHAMPFEVKEGMGVFACAHALLTYVTDIDGNQLFHIGQVGCTDTRVPKDMSSKNIGSALLALCKLLRVDDVSDPRRAHLITVPTNVTSGAEENARPHFLFKMEPEKTDTAYLTLTDSELLSLEEQPVTAYTSRVCDSNSTAELVNMHAEQNAGLYAVQSDMSSASGFNKAVSDVRAQSVPLMGYSARAAGLRSAQLLGLVALDSEKEVVNGTFVLQTMRTEHIGTSVQTFVLRSKEEEFRVAST